MSGYLQALCYVSAFLFKLKAFKAEPIEVRFFPEAP
jgi:hypothetical protein